mgnify:FL=1
MPDKTRQVLRRYEVTFRDQSIETVPHSPGKAYGEPKADAVAFRQDSSLMWAMMEHNLLIYAWDRESAIRTLEKIYPKLDGATEQNPSRVMMKEYDLSDEERSFIHSRSDEAVSICDGAWLSFKPKIIETRSLGNGAFASGDNFTCAALPIL